MEDIYPLLAILTHTPSGRGGYWIGINTLPVQGRLFWLSDRGRRCYHYLATAFRPRKEFFKTARISPPRFWFVHALQLKFNSL